jgi:phosphatidyl-N-methylethanolamine N-methyltransferase
VTPVHLPLLVASMLLLAAERLAYAFIWQHPATFRAWCAHPVARVAGGPVEVVRALFVVFKMIQAAVFAAWIGVHGDGNNLLTASPPAFGLGTLLIVVGQTLNAGVFLRLGTIGVFYGNRFGSHLPWVTGFPFSIVSHPQYVGTVMTIWGLFLVTRYPHADWSVLPLVETVYYAWGSYAESDAR